MSRSDKDAHNELYTDEQLQAYFTYISFPNDKHIDVESASARESLEYLSLLQNYQLASVPFENLCMHYSKDKLVSLNKDDLFEKIVASRNGRGGHCMETNHFFATILKSLGYEVTAVGARVAQADGASGGWNHRVNIVCIEGVLYLVDVGFGGNGITKPMLLKHGATSKWGAREAENRLLFQEASNPAFQGIWTLEHRKTLSHNWTIAFSFAMTEFVPGDFEVMNAAVVKRMNSWFTFRIICVKFILDEDRKDFIGALILDGPMVKKKVFEETEVLVECTTEEQRIQALKEYFGIKLSEKEIAGIKGTVVELKESFHVGE